jgi:WD40 repeat protein
MINYCENIFSLRNNGSMRVETVIPNKSSSDSQINDLFFHATYELVKVWNLEKNEIKAYLHQDIERAIYVNICLSNRLVFGLISGSLFTWKLEEKNESKNLIYELSHLKILSLVCPNDEDLFISTEDQYIQLWSWSSKKIIQTFEGELHKYSIAIDRDKNILATTVNNNIKIWNLSTGKEIFNLKGHSAIISTLNICSNNNTLVSSSVNGYIGLWDLNTGKLIYLLQGSNTNPIAAITIEPISNIAIVGRWNGWIELWDLKNGRKIYEFQAHKHRVRCISVSSLNNELFTSCGWDGMIKIWQMSTMIS